LRSPGANSSAPTAQLIGYFSRKGAKDAKLAKKEKRVFVSYPRLLITRYAHLQNPFLPFASFAPLRLCERNYRKNRATGADEVFSSASSAR